MLIINLGILAIVGLLAFFLGLIIYTTIEIAITHQGASDQ